MNIKKNIDTATYFINKLSEDLPKIKNDAQRNFNIDMLNSFIVLINTVELLAKGSKNMVAIDSLLIGRLYSQLYQSAAIGERIDLSLICRNIDTDLKYNHSLGVEKVAKLLQSHELTMLYKEGTLSAESIAAIKPSNTYKEMITDLLDQFKAQISWN